MLPLLYAETKVHPELVRVVEMGPFKHQVDDGLDARKVDNILIFSVFLHMLTLIIYLLSSFPSTSSFSPYVKTAFECMHSLLKSCYTAIDMPAFIDRCREGLSDQYDIQVCEFTCALYLCVVV